MQLAQQQADIQQQQAMAAFAQANPQVYAQMVNAQQQAPDQGGGQGGYDGQPSDDGGFGGGYGDGSEPGDDGSIDWGDSGNGSSRDIAELEDSDL